MPQGNLSRPSTPSIPSRRRVKTPQAALLLCLVLGLVGVLAARAGHAAELDPERKILHVLNRLTYGPAPGDIARVREMGVAKFIESQLEPETLPESEALKKALERYGTAELDTVTLFREYGPKPDAAGGELTPEIVREAKDQAEVVAREASEAKITRAILSSRQLQELMVDFWFNHFNVDADKGLAHLWAGSFEREAIRPHAMGRFLDLLAAASMHPAMLIFLDNWRNHVGRGDDGLPDYSRVNETFARNLLDVHTLGPDQDRSALDVNALAKIFTGWRIGAGNGGTAGSGFVFDVEAHDPMDKTFLGEIIKGRGLQEGVLVLKRLSEDPRTAENICRKLAAYFVADDPPEALVKRLAKAFLDSGGATRYVLKTLFESPEFFDEQYFQGKFKTPYRLVVSAARSVREGRVGPSDGADSEIGASRASFANPLPLLGFLDMMGMPLLFCPAPSGYKTQRMAWLNPAALGKRFFFAASLGQGEVPLWSGAPEPKPLDARTLAGVLGGDLPEKVLEAAKKAPPGLGAAMILGSPAFQSY